LTFRKKVLQLGGEGLWLVSVILSHILQEIGQKSLHLPAAIRRRMINHKGAMIPMTYELKVAGLTRHLPVCPLNESLSIAGFVLFGDVELTVACARELLKLAPDFDYMIAPEAKAIPLIHEMARQSGRGEYLLTRKAPKAYMRGVFRCDYESITTKGVQTQYMDAEDAAKMKGKRILILDDVISTGESLRAMEQLVTQAGGIIVGRMAVLAEGDAAKRTDITVLAPLPLFDGEGKVLG
jgi:adenine phosphoribosyltransferase